MTWPLQPHSLPAPTPILVGSLNARSKPCLRAWVFTLPSTQNILPPDICMAHSPPFIPSQGLPWPCHLEQIIPFTPSSHCMLLFRVPSTSDCNEDCSCLHLSSWPESPHASYHLEESLPHRSCSKNITWMNKVALKLKSGHVISQWPYYTINNAVNFTYAIYEIFKISVNEPKFPE